MDAGMRADAAHILAPYAGTMTPEKKRKVSIREAGGFARWLTIRLLPLIGPPPLGPYDDETPEQASAVRYCPLCGQPMDLHDIDRSGEQTQVHCPAPRNGSAV
jgi:hypothetical protein